MQDPAFQKIFQTVRRGFSTPHKLVGVPGRMSGCIYDEDGAKVALSERFGGHMGDYVISENPEVASRPDGATPWPGRGLYLGHYMGGHYGHFIAETLSSFWIFEQFQAEQFDYFLFHPFVFGTELPSYVRYCFEAFGIDERKVRFVGSDAIAFEELVVPERLFRLNHSADPRLKWVYHHIAEKAPIPQAAPTLLYLSRRRFSRGNFERVVANEVRIENAFRAYGFEILYPEHVAFERQVALYHHADIVAGISGSGLHNSLFMRQDAMLIELGDPRYDGKPAPTQALCNAVSGVRSAFIPFRGRRFGLKGTMLFEIGFLDERLNAVLEHPYPGPARARTIGTLGARVSEMLEIAYLSARPMLGSVARDVLSWLGLAQRRRAG